MFFLETKKSLFFGNINVPETFNVMHTIRSFCLFPYQYYMCTNNKRGSGDKREPD